MYVKFASLYKMWPMAKVRITSCYFNMRSYCRPCDGEQYKCVTYESEIHVKAAPSGLLCRHSFICRLFTSLCFLQSGQEVHASITSSTQPSATCCCCHLENCTIFIFFTSDMGLLFSGFFRSELIHRVSAGVGFL